MRPLKVLLAACVFGLAAAPALAHHNANAAYDTSREIQRTGPLVEIRDIAPHARWKFVVIDPVTKAQTQWDLEAMGNAQLRRLGLRVREDLKPGTVVTYIFTPSRDGSNTGLLTALILDGKTYRMATF